VSSCHSGVEMEVSPYNRDMEHRMNSSHGVQKVKCEGLWTGLSNYLVWFKVLFGEFLQWTSRPEVL